RARRSRGGACAPLAFPVRRCGAGRPQEIAESGLGSRATLFALKGGETSSPPVRNGPFPHRSPSPPVRVPDEDLEGVPVVRLLVAEAACIADCRGLLCLSGALIKATRGRQLRCRHPSTRTSTRQPAPRTRSRQS